MKSWRTACRRSGHVVFGGSIRTMQIVEPNIDQFPRAEPSRDSTVLCYSEVINCNPLSDLADWKFFGAGQTASGMVGRRAHINVSNRAGLNTDKQIQTHACWCVAFV